ncbi:MAG TPA: ice-binding family protein [Anaerolineales bacterium]|nr:ice-binding family protein [Anaerolineales bacterium]
MKKIKNLINVFILVSLFVVMGSPSPSALAGSDANAPNLGTAASFVALASSTLTNTGPGVYIGDVGTSPGTSITGFPPGTVINGSIYMGGSVPDQAQIDALAAYNDLDGQTCNVNLTGQDLGGMTLNQDVYCFDTSAQLTGNIVLDAQGNSNAVWVFQTGSTLTTASDSSVILINGGNPLNVFWQIGSSTTLGTYTRFQGNIIAFESITSDTGASLVGRAIALNGAITLNTNETPYPIANVQILNIYLPLMVDPSTTP